MEGGRWEGDRTCSSKASAYASSFIAASAARTDAMPSRAPQWAPLTLKGGAKARESAVGVGTLEWGSEWACPKSEARSGAACAAEGACLGACAQAEGACAEAEGACAEAACTTSTSDVLRCARA